MPNRFLITGTGRCGTHWASRVLQCGHQAVFRHEHSLGEPHYWGNQLGDASFEAVPLLPIIRPELSRVVLLVRNPYRVIRSWLAVGAFGANMRADYGMWSSVLDIFFPTVLASDDPVERAARFWCDWNMAVLPYATHVLRVEDTTSARLAEVVGVDDWVDTAPTNTGPGHDLTLDVWLPEPGRRLASQLGYRP